LSNASIGRCRLNPRLALKTASETAPKIDGAFLLDLRPISTDDTGMPLDETFRPAPLADRTSARRPRLVSLDVFRGMTVAAMLLVNDPGDWGTIYWPLRHAAWHGWTPTDLIFPFFLFMVGITTRLSLARRRTDGADRGALIRQILRRGLLLFLLGLFLNWFPGYEPGPGAGDLGARILDRLLHLRIPGVLQRIALIYVVIGFLTLKTSLKFQILLLPPILLGYWALLIGGTGGPTGLAALSPPSGTTAALVDRALLDWGRFGNHLWDQGVSWDPEGALSTLPALATALIGACAGAWLDRRLPLDRRVAGLALAGVTGVAAGLAWNLILPINKNLWTPSYVLLSGGFAALALAFIMAIVEQARLVRWAKPFLAFGINPILAYLGAELMATLIYEVIPVPDTGGSTSLQNWIYRHGFTWWLHAENASLGFAIAFVLLWWAILAGLHKRGIILKI
jgi:predicted acyltransferase